MTNNDIVCSAYRGFILARPRWWFVVSKFIAELYNYGCLYAYELNLLGIILLFSIKYLVIITVIAIHHLNGSKNYEVYHVIRINFNERSFKINLRVAWTVRD